jgi:signal peptidase I
MSYRWQQRFIFGLIGIGVSSCTIQPGLSDVPPTPDNPLISEFLCLKVIEDNLAKARIGGDITEEDKKILAQCRNKFSFSPNPDAPLPTPSQCVALMQGMLEEGLAKLLELNLSETQARSLERCKEVVKVYSFPSGSMEPTLQIGDRFVLDRTAYKTRSPQRGDLIIFEPTERLKKDNFNDLFTNRVIGLPGETVEVKNGIVYINSKPLKEKYVEEPPKYEYGPAVIPANNYFVLGDNRNNSYDSHIWGFVPRNLILGKVIWRLYPLERAGSLSQPFIARTAKAKQSEAKQNISTINKTQMSYLLENSSFANTFDRLRIGKLSGSSTSETTNYSYKIVMSNSNITVTTATAKEPTLKSYSGAVVKYKDSDDLSAIAAVICETSQPSQIPPPIPQTIGAAPVCPPNSVTVQP